MRNARIILPFLAVMAVLVLIMPRTAKFDYEYRKGAPWKYETLVAQFDFPLLKTPEQMMEESLAQSQRAVPYYRYSQETVSREMQHARSLDLGEHSYLSAGIVSSLDGICSRFIVSDEGVKGEGTEVIYVQKDKRAVKYPASEVLRLSDAKASLLSEVSKLDATVDADSILKAAGVYDILETNLIYDAQTTGLVRDAGDNTISPTLGYVKEGQLIVSRGEIVTAEISQMLDSYKKEYEATVGYEGPRILQWVGNILVALTLVLVLFFALFFTTRGVFVDGRFLYVLTVYLITAGAAILLCRTGSDIIMLWPFTLSALLLQAFFKNRLIFSVYTASLLPLLIFSDRGVMLFVMFLMAGLVAVYSFTYFNRGWKQFLTAFFTFLTLAVIYSGFRLIDYTEAGPFRDLILLLLSSLLAVAGYPLIYLFERIFNLVSNSRLGELSDTSSSLLRELEQKAPGTFQHSLQVMNMADAAARAIGANEQLVRAGALYHDIGKMCNPQCFVENESLLGGEAGTYHSELTPLQSAHDIIRHVDDGMDLARRHKLPQLVSEFILTHHGTSAAAYFYTKFLNEGGDPALEPEFHYNGRKPHTREQVILMLCDSIEAASRTLTDNSPESYDRFVENMVSSKMKDGQLDESDISIRELILVKEELKTYLARIYHERVTYPKRKKTTK